jgi:hypothetical protein
MWCWCVESAVLGAFVLSGRPAYIWCRGKWPFEIMPALSSPQTRSPLPATATITLASLSHARPIHTHTPSTSICPLHTYTPPHQTHASYRHMPLNTHASLTSPTHTQAHADLITHSCTHTPTCTHTHTRAQAGSTFMEAVTIPARSAPMVSAGGLVLL